MLFNNAGGGYAALGRMKTVSVVETPEQDWDAILAIILRGVRWAASTPYPLCTAGAAGDPRRRLDQTASVPEEWPPRCSRRPVADEKTKAFLLESTPVDGGWTAR